MKKKASKHNRRDFLKQTGIVGSGIALSLSATAFKDIDAPVGKGKFLEIVQPENLYQVKPLSLIHLTTQRSGSIQVYDGQGVLYLETNIKDEISFQAGGGLGGHLILLFDRRNRLLDAISFQLNCQTEIKDKEGEFERFANMLYFTFTNSRYGIGRVRRMNGKNYLYFSSWFQDHMYGMKAAKYFFPELKSGVDLYTDGQRDDGMIHDNYKHPWEPNSNWLARFEYGNFVKIPESPDSSCIYVRVPVENMAEFTYLETIYYTWKATGDNEWMKSKLDSAIKAVEYSTSDPYRWSEKHKLLKRGYTIDIWDFQANKDTEIAGGDTMRVYLDKTRFGIMYGDNVRMAASCGFLAEMLEFAGRSSEAKKIRKTGRGLKKRIDELAWNGKFYTHHIPLEGDYERDFGDTDTSKQVTMSNAWALNRGVSHEQAVAIIKTYQSIQKEMPASSPGEWYCCYPPFEKGFHVKKWNYMNGGVSPICAGELAHGAFEHGFEDYAVDILRRVDSLAEKTGYSIKGCYKGKMPKAPERTFIPLSLREIANADTHGAGGEGVPGWTGEGENDLHNFPVGKQTFNGIPFDIVNPVKNNRKACLILSSEKPYKRKVQLMVNQKAKSIYILQAMSKGDIAGALKLHYSDGSTYTKYMKKFGGKHGAGEIRDWWYPSVPEPRKGIPHLKIAWKGKNKFSKKIGICNYGMENPHPDKKIQKMEFIGMEDGTKWMVLGVSLCDSPVFFMPTIVSTIPQHWAAAECYYALIEGLAGIKDTGVAFNKALLAPRWESAGVNEASATARYASSNGYLSYKYIKINSNQLKLQFTSNAQNTDVEILLPANKTAVKMQVNDKPEKINLKKIENSTYACFTNHKAGVNTILLELNDI